MRGGKIKPANKKFSALKNDYEITFDDTTVVVAVDDADETAIPMGKVS